MDTDALLEFLGIRPRAANAGMGAGSVAGAMAGAAGAPNMRGASQPLPDPRLAGQPGYDVNTPPSQAPDDLMNILNRNRQDPAVTAEAQRAMAPVAAPMQDAISAEERSLRDIEAEILQAQEQQQRRVAMSPEDANRPAPTPGMPIEMQVSRALAALGSRQPGRNPAQVVIDSYNQPQAPTTAMTPEMRAPPPQQSTSVPGTIADPNAGMPQYPTPPQAVPNPFEPPPTYADAPPPNRPPEVPVQTPPANYPGSPGVMAAMAAMDPQTSQIINGGPFQTMEPPNPFAEAFPPGVMPATNRPAPAPSPNYINNRRANPLPFTNPSAAPVRPQTEGMPMLSEPVGVKPLVGAQPFTPQGPLIDAFMSGNAPRQMPAPAPRPAANGGTGQIPLPPMPSRTGPDTSTVLNQAELARFLAASGGGSPPPAAPSAPSPTPLASAPTPPLVPLPPGATAMTPPPAPQVGQQMPEAMKEQLLAAAYNVLAQRNQPQTLGAR